MSLKPSHGHPSLWFPQVLLLGLILASGACTAATPTTTPTATRAPLPTLLPPFPIITIEDFEAGLGQWFPEGDVPMDPNNPGRLVAWSVLVSSSQAFEGDGSAEFFLDGRQADGTIWIARPMRVNTEEPVKVALTFQLWSESESFNTLARVAAYAGARKPAAEEELDTSQVANLVTGWREYNYAFSVLPHEGSLWVAVGITVAWETEMTYYIDDIRVEVTR
ncbi:MAG: hypothetical protein HW388_165 [Dehalococcoidia bacterium]|nr:hypothetical protein [Dehalococcoidia bacterium]